MTVRFGGDTSGLSSAVGGVKNILGGLPGPAGLAAGAIVGVTAAVIGIGAVSVKMAADYEQGMNKVKALTGSSDDAMRKYDTGVKQLAVDAGVAPKALTDGLYNVLSASYKDADAMKVLTLATEDAKIGMTSATVTTDALTNVLRAFSVQNKDITRTNGEMLETVTLGKSTFEEYASRIVKAADASVQFKVSMETMNAAWSTMTSAGIHGAQATTDFVQSLKVMYGNIGTVTKGLEKNGIAFNEAKFNAMSYGDKIVYLNKAIEQANEKHVKITGVTLQAAQAFSVISNHIKDYNNNLALLSDKQAMAEKTAKAWAITQDGFNQQMDRAKAALSVLAINIGQQLLPVLTQIVGSVTPVISAFGDWVTKTNLIQNALNFLGNLVGNIVNPIKDGFNAIFYPVKQVADAFQFVNIQAKPLLDTFDRATGIFKQTEKGLQPLSDTFDRATYILNHTSKAAAPLLDTFDRATGVFKQANQTTAPLLDTFDRATAVFPKTTKVVKDAENPWKVFFQNVKNVIDYLVKIDWGGIGNNINKVVSVIRQIGNAIQPAITGFQKMQSMMGGGIGSPEAFKHIADAIQFISNALSKVDWAKVFKSVGDALSSIGNFLKTTFIPVWTQLVNSFNDIKTALQPVMPQLQQFAIVVGLTIVGAIIIAVAIIAGLIDAFASIVSGVASMVSGVIQFLSGLLQTITGIMTLISDVFSGKFGKIGADIDNIMQGIVRMVVGAFNFLHGLWMSTLGAVQAFTDGFGQAIINIFQNLFNTLVGHSIIPDMVNAIVRWISQLPGKIASFAGGIISGLTSPFTSAASTIQGILSKIGGWINNTLGNIGNLASKITGIHIPGFASGGRNLAPGWKVVGENGPELMYTPGGTDIYRNGTGPNMGSSSGTSGDQHIYIQLDGNTLTHVVSSRQAKLVRLKQGRRAA